MVFFHGTMLTSQGVKMIEEPISQEPIPETPKPRWKLWVAAGGCLILLCGMAFVGILIFAGPKFVQYFIPEKIQVAEESPLPVTQNNTMGDPTAPVHIIEYGDFQCPYCLKFWTETEPQMIEEYVKTNKVYFEFRAYPILGPESGWAAEGAYCAGDQGKFWEYHDTLFTNWTGENVGDFTKEKLVKYAKALDLNMEEFQACISEEKHKGTVEQDAVQAEADGVHATPTFFINGVKVEGSQSYSALKQFIEQALDGNMEIQSG
jgi:protein-disulfide isomerase